MSNLLEQRADALMSEIDRVLRRNQSWDLNETEDRLELRNALMPFIRASLEAAMEAVRP